MRIGGKIEGTFASVDERLVGKGRMSAPVLQPQVAKSDIGVGKLVAIQEPATLL